MRASTIAANERSFDSGALDVGKKLPDLSIGGFTEEEVFAFAPVHLTDRVHWTVEAHRLDADDLDMELLVAALSVPAHTRQWSDGILRVWVPQGCGETAREEIRDYAQVRGWEPKNLRVEASVPFRDVTLIPAGLLEALLAEAAAWLLPRTRSIQSRLVADIDGIDEGDMLGLIYLFCSDLVDRFDDKRAGKNGSLNFLAFAWGKLRNWPLDIARSRYGRVVLADRIALSRLEGQIASESGRAPTEAEKAEALGVSVTDMRRREAVINSLSRARYADAAAIGEGAESGEFIVESNADVAQEVEQRHVQSLVASHIARAVAPGESLECDPLGFAATYLTYWEGMSQSDIARLFDASPRTVRAALTRVHERMDPAALS